MISPHEPWDYSFVGFPAPVISSSFPKAVVMNLERNELSEWVEHVTKQLIHDMPDTSSESLHTDTTIICSEDNINNINIAPSSLLIDDDYFRTRKANRRSYFDGGNNEEEFHWSNNVLGNQSNICENLTGTSRRLLRIDEQGLSLINLLLECTVAISVDNIDGFSLWPFLCAERVVADFAKTMASRVMNSLLVFNNVSPFIKFAHFTSNQAILEAFHRRDRVHIIDLDIMQGLQWPALFNILATRIEGPPHVRMTGLGTSIDLLIETAKQLSNFAKRPGISFEFHPIAKKFGEIDVSMVPLRTGEILAVHWLQHSLYDATGPDWKTMRLLEELAPRVITLAEQDISHGGSFLDRSVGSLHYYSTLFDSLGEFLPLDDPSRHSVEHCLLYREINNILAIGGHARSGEDKFRHWRSVLATRSSFMQVPMSGNSMAQAQLILNMFPPACGYSLVQGDGTLKLGWKDANLFTASSWASHASIDSCN
ncbi:hypothetical protein P3X46_017800 [Hevea brasiliensis]|uniref:Uncharacterized protein n=1 Tax=Hevea brasiliensis TaxID=3981 RepID=A0ABQ9LNT1_HEVBR|nr:hypothetical protein P3X46_017800 [Hevea brasiliensis]